MFRRPEAIVDDEKQQRNNDAYDIALSELGLSIARGAGAPTHSPVGPQLWLRTDGAAGSAIYAWDTATWTVVV